MQIETFVYNKPFILTKRLFAPLLTLFMDFKTLQEAILPFDGLRPYLSSCVITTARNSEDLIPLKRYFPPFARIIQN
jgi:hypothetical protein